MLESVISKNIIVGHVNDDLYNICLIMKEYDVGFLPIVDKNKVVGVITDRDIVVNFISNHDKHSFISNYMNRDIVAVDINSSIDEVLSVLATNRIKRVLVVDGNKLVGVVSISDLFGLSDKVLSTIESIFKIGPNRHDVEPKIDEFYL